MLLMVAMIQQTVLIGMMDNDETGGDRSDNTGGDSDLDTDDVAISMRITTMTTRYKVPCVGPHASSPVCRGPPQIRSKGEGRMCRVPCVSGLRFGVGIGAGVGLGSSG